MPSNFSEARQKPFTAAFARTPRGWVGAEVDLSDAETEEDVDEAVRDALGLGGLIFLCAEVEEEWFAIIRLENGEQARVFVSDVQTGLHDEVYELIMDLAGAVPSDDPDLGVKPAGDVDLLSDHGVAAEELVELSMEEGILPADTLSVIADRLGFAEELDRLR
ncbi:tRNA adenosine deaminase-associated protein [Rhizohabitans arisaemae]|uniref:tRNA adenosine deaminase-associated protein n=1 Tax=Rhizohabitans arisaemae TaxID=2720610 RepID=UPI0024B10A32|nr:tRNA adenosine deaminase-associated protein [Rhizohabitans arisaemae]